MPKQPFFNKVSWGWYPEQYGYPFDKLTKAPESAPSSYYDSAVPKAVPTAKLNSSVLRAMQRLFLITNGVEGLGGVCRTERGHYMAQISHVNGSCIHAVISGKLRTHVKPEYGYTQVYYNPATGKYLGANVDAEGRRSKLTPEQSNTAFFVTTLMHAIESDAEAGELWERYCKLQYAMSVHGSADEVKDLKTLSEIATKLSDNFYRRINYYDAVETKHPGCGIKANIDSVGELKEAHLSGIRPDFGDGKIDGVGELSSDHPEKEEAEAEDVLRVSDSGKPASIAELKGYYAIDSTRTFTEEEQALIPEVPESYQITDEITEVCEMIKASTQLPTPMRNFLFVGGAGSGKTEAVKMIAYALGLPLLHQPCGVDTEKFDIAQQVIPDGAGGFKYVKGPLMQACEKGYVCEISEADLILKQGTLGEFNPLLDKTGTYPLSTGEIVKRHPDTVLIFTMNGDYEGCRNINQAVRNRCKVYLFDTPSDEVLIKRIKSESGYKDTAVIKKMVDVYHRIREYCEINSVTDGAVGVRNLINWASATVINGRPHHNAFSSMVLGATFDKELHQDLMACVETQFAPEEVKCP